MKVYIDTTKTPQFITWPLIALFSVPIIFALYNFVQILLS